MTGQWIEIAPHRVYFVERLTSDDWELINANGQPCGIGEDVAIFRRRSDAKLFRASRVFAGKIRLKSIGLEPYANVLEEA